MFLAIVLLGIIIDAAVNPIVELAESQGVMDGPFGAPIAYVTDVGYLAVGILFVSVALWLLFGPVTRTRVEDEEQRRRLR